MAIIPEILFVFVMIIEGYIARKYFGPDKHSKISINFFDRYFFYIIGLSIFLSFTAGHFFTSYYKINYFHIILFSVIGVIMFFVGYIYRIYSISYLGRYFSVRLMIQKNHCLVSSGPYAKVRHPSYLGGCVSLIGMAISSGNLATILLVSTSTMILYLVRISHEERILLEIFPEYESYKSRTYAIIPGII